MQAGDQSACVGVGVQQSLEQLALHTLILWKHCIGSLGETPQDLLEPVLNHCSAPHLAQIEDESSADGRQSPLHLDLHWRRCFMEDFGSLDRPPEAACWREAYQLQLAVLAEKRQRTGDKLRILWNDAKKQKQERTLKVIDAKAQLQRRRPLAYRGNTAARKAPPSARLRLSKKLGLTLPRRPPATMSSQPRPVSLQKPGPLKGPGRSQPESLQKPRGVLEAVDLWEPSRPPSAGSQAMTPDDLRRIAKDNWKRPCSQPVKFGKTHQRQA